MVKPGGSLRKLLMDELPDSSFPCVLMEPILPDLGANVVDVFCRGRKLVILQRMVISRYFLRDKDDLQKTRI